MAGSETAKAGRREWIGLAVLALPCLLVTMDVTVLYLAIPELTADLRPSSAELLWITDVYGFLIAGSLITMGTLGDRIGRRRLLLIGAAAFGVASILAAVSTSPAMLIAARALLGIAGATLMPSTLSLIANMFADPGERTTAIAVWATSLSLGAALGPLLGGVLLERFAWGSVFLLAVPVMVLLLVAGPRLLPEFRDPEAGRLDLRSAGMSLAAVLLVIYGLKRAVEHGAGALPAAAAALGLALAVVFVRRQRRLDDPLIDVRLFRRPAFSASLAANALSIFTILGIELFVAQYLQLVLGMGPLEAGLWTLPSAAGFLAGSMVTPLIARRVDPRSVVIAALVVGAVGFVGLAGVGATTSLTLVVGASVVYSFASAPVVTLSTDLIVGAAPPAAAGSASAVSETGSEMGGALGIAILGSLGTAVYRAEVGGSVPSGTADAARDTLGGAVEADGLPAGVLTAAVDAFSSGMQLAALTAAVLLLGMAVAAARYLQAAPAEARAEVDDPCLGTAAAG